MKKALLTFATLAICSVAMNAQQRLVLYEEFTGENCGPCAAQNPGLEALMAAGTNPNKIVHITFMEPIPSSGYFYSSLQTDNHNRLYTYYGNMFSTMSGGFLFTPSGVRDGSFPDGALGYAAGEGQVSTFTQTDIDSEYAVTSPFNIVATHLFNAAKDSVTLTVKVTAVSAASGTLMLRCAWVRTMNFTSPPGNNGETHFENVVRKFFTPITLPSSWTAGTSNTYTFKDKISHLDTFTNVTAPDSVGVVWIQNDANLRVLQAARASGTTTAVHEVTNTVSDVNLHPNPASNKTNISFTLSDNADVQVSIVDALGREIANIANQHMGTGAQLVSINTTSLAAGTYFVRLLVNDYTQTLPLVIMK